MIDEARRLIRAIADLWPAADRGRCAAHRLRNILAKLPERPGLHARVRAAYWAALDGTISPFEAEYGLRAPTVRSAPSTPRPQQTSPTICRPWRRSRSSAPASPAAALDQPAGAAPGEVRRRTKVIGRFLSETSCLTMGLGGHGPCHRRQSWPRADAARPSRDRRPHRRPGDPRDGPGDRITYPCRGARAVGVFPAGPGRNPWCRAGMSSRRHHRTPRQDGSPFRGARTEVAQPCRGIVAT